MPSKRGSTFKPKFLVDEIVLVNVEKWVVDEEKRTVEFNEERKNYEEDPGKYESERFSNIHPDLDIDLLQAIVVASSFFGSDIGWSYLVQFRFSESDDPRYEEKLLDEEYLMKATEGEADE